uniref:Uncharacterized protein n=1 Tax=Salix viminalis TaxID=40686 RepID=A0A6N2K383_SALVM
MPWLIFYGGMVDQGVTSGLFTLSGLTFRHQQTMLLIFCCGSYKNMFHMEHQSLICMQELVQLDYHWQPLGNAGETQAGSKLFRSVKCVEVNKESKLSFEKTVERLPNHVD